MVRSFTRAYTQAHISPTALHITHSLITQTHTPHPPTTPHLTHPPEEELQEEEVREEFSWASVLQDRLSGVGGQRGGGGVGEGDAVKGGVFSWAISSGVGVVASALVLVETFTPDCWCCRCCRCLMLLLVGFPWIYKDTDTHCMQHIIIQSCAVIGHNNDSCNRNTEHYASEEAADEPDWISCHHHEELQLVSYLMNEMVPAELTSATCASCTHKTQKRNIISLSLLQKYARGNSNSFILLPGTCQVPMMRQI